MRSDRSAASDPRGSSGPLREVTLLAPLAREFFEGRAIDIARDLLGRMLWCTTAEGVTTGLIVETEAYLGSADPASHLAAGRTPRTAPFFQGAGTIYVYAIHRHACVNVITSYRGRPEAVLFRALQPLDGIELMQARRETTVPTALTSGPGKICRAMQITTADTGLPLGNPRIAIHDTTWRPPVIGVSPRVGISKAAGWPLRFFVRGNPHVSRTPRRVAADPGWDAERFYAQHFAHDAHA